VASAEDLALIGEEHREVLAGLRQLPHRQREALILRYFLDLPEPEIARSMGITEGTVKSTTSRALAALARLLGESRRHRCRTGPPSKTGSSLPPGPPLGLFTSAIVF
jgi:DNA-directed RNA polymerase specialized sigma24 family protein